MKMNNQVKIIAAIVTLVIAMVAYKITFELRNKNKSPDDA